MNLNDKALLVQLSISQWTARKYDKRVTEQVAQANGTTTAVGRYNKSLLPCGAALDTVHAKTAYIRKRYYDNTLPWGLDGTQMLPSKNYLNFITEFRQERTEWLALVETFLQHYPHMQQAAQNALGALYNPDDYPTLSVIRSKFNMDLAVFPVPDTDFRVTINDEELNGIKADIERRVQHAERQAMHEIWQRLHERVSHIATKLADPDGIFRDSMMENLRDLCDTLPKLNFNDDITLADMLQEVRTKLLHNPDTLRTNPTMRQDTAHKATDIINRMREYMVPAV